MSRPADAARAPAVLLVAYHFAPENTSGTHRPLHFARALLEAGWDVHVLTVAREALAHVDPTLERVFPHPERVHRVGKRATWGDRYMALKRMLARRGADQGGRGRTRADEGGRTP